MLAFSHGGLSPPPPLCQSLRGHVLPGVNILDVPQSGTSLGKGAECVPSPLMPHTE